MRDLLIEEENRVGMITFMMNEQNLQRILAHPLVIIGSDGAAVAPYGNLSKGQPHPRFYGTFPRVLGKYARDENIFSLPGMGNLAVEATYDRDFPIITGIMIILAFVVLLTNLLVDLTYAWVDPRIRFR